MVTTKFKLKSGDLEIEMEGDQKYIDKKFTEISKKIFGQPTVSTIPESIRKIKPSETKTLLTKDDLKGIMEYDSQDKPRLIVANAVKKLSLSEVMMLFFYVYEPQKMSLKEIQKIISDNYTHIPITSVSAVMATTLKGRVIREGKRGSYIYSLSGSGRDFVKSTISKLRSEKSQ